MPDDAADRWQRKLKDMNLHVRPVDATQVFYHEPSKNIVREDLQRAVLEKFRIFHALELGFEMSKPWDRLFMLQKHFDTYNRIGMTAQDPMAYKWAATKYCFFFKD